MWNLTATLSNSEQVPCLLASSAIDTHLLCAKGILMKEKASILRTKAVILYRWTYKRHYFFFQYYL